MALESNLHSMIRGDLEDDAWAKYLILPDLNALTELDVPDMWFPIPQDRPPHGNDRVSVKIWVSNSQWH
jgi:hypothetical protein